MASLPRNAPVGTLAGAATPAARPSSQVPSEQDLLRANSYLLQHAQHTAVAARPVALPFAQGLDHARRPLGHAHS